MADLFKLQGVVDISTGKSDATLKRVDSAAKSTEQSLGKLDTAAKRAGGAVSSTSGYFDRAAGSAGRLSSAIQSLAGKMGSLRGAGGEMRNELGMLGIARGNLLSGVIESAISGVTGALKDGLQAGIEYNKMLESGTVRMTRFFESAQQTQKFVADIEKFAAISPVFGFKEAMDGAQRLLQMKFAAKDIPKMLQDIGDAVGGVGGGAFEIGRVTHALGQMVGTGRIQSDEMNQLTEAQIPAWELLSKAIGKTEAETRKLVEAGQVGGRRGVQGIVAMMGETFAGQSERAAQTLAGQQAQFDAALQKSLGGATTGAFGELKKGYQTATEGLSTQGAQVFGNEINKLLTEQGKKINEKMQDVGSGKLFQQGAEVVDTLGKADTLADRVAKKLKDLGATSIFDLGKSEDPIDKFIFGGIEKALKAVGLLGAEEGKKAGAQIGEGIKQGTADALQIKSPSRVMMSLGMDAVQGFVDGIDAGFEANKKKITKSPIDIEKMRAQLLDDLRKLRDDPATKAAIRAMLDTIASAEGANYNTLFGGGTFSSYADHPNTPITRKLGGKNITSTAAGRYQFLAGTWSGIQNQTGLKDFSPESQDLGAILLMRQRGMLGPLARGDVSGALTMGNREWASLPGSPYGQPTKKAETLIDVYNTALEKLNASTQIVAQTMQSLAVSLPPVAQSFERIKAIAPALPNLLQGRSAGQMVPGGEVITEVRGSLGAVTSDLTELPEALNKLSTETTLGKAAFDKSAVAMKQAGSQAGQFSDAIQGAGKKTKEAIDTLAPLRESVAGGFDSVIDALTEGGDRLKDAALNAGRDFLKGLQGSLFSSLSGGKATSPGQFLAQSLFSGAGGGSAGGSFLTGGFAGGNPAAAILGGGGNSGGGGILSGILGGGKSGGLGGLLGKIPGLGGIFGGAKAGGMIGTLPGVTKFPVGLTGAPGATGAAGGLAAGLGATGLLAGGGILGSMLGGKSPVGRLLGGIGGTLLGGAAAGSGIFGGAMAAALPALFSNPFTAIIGGALVGGALLSRLFGGGIEKSLKKLTQGEYGIKIDDSTAKALRSIGESKFGKQFKGKQIETIRLPESRDLLAEYASATGQKGNSKLFTTAEFSDPYSSANLMKRALGGPVSAGMPYLVGERRPEVFVPSQSGRIVPSVDQYGGGGGSIESVEKTLQRLEKTFTRFAVARPDDVIMAARPSTIAKQNERDFRRRGESSIAQRNLGQKR